jgi:hypothetical protein
MACRSVLAVVAASLAALVAPPADAHDWYPAWCCSDKDCRALFEERGETVVEEADGWRLWDGRVAERGSAKPSPDRRFHVCEEATTKAIICFFAPLGGA